MKKSILPLAVLLALCAALLTGCGSGDRTEPPMPLEEAAESARTPAPTDTPDPNAPQEYVAEGVGRFYLPAGFEMVCDSTEEPLPMHSVTFTRGDVTIYGSRFGTDAYEKAGVPLPTDLEDFASRDGVRKDIPADREFATDDLGNMYVDWIDSDGRMVYYVLKSGADSYGCVIGYCPEGDMAAVDIPQWLSQAVLD